VQGRAQHHNHTVLFVQEHVNYQHSLFIQLTFDLQKHEFLVWHGTVVGHLLRDANTAQVDVAEVLLAGQTGESHFRETRVLIHCREHRGAQTQQRDTRLRENSQTFKWYFRYDSEGLCNEHSRSWQPVAVLFLSEKMKEEVTWRQLCASLKSQWKPAAEQVQLVNNTERLKPPLRDHRIGTRMVVSSHPKRARKGSLKAGRDV